MGGNDETCAFTAHGRQFARLTVGVNGRVQQLPEQDEYEFRSAKPKPQVMIYGQNSIRLTSVAQIAKRKRAAWNNALNVW